MMRSLWISKTGMEAQQMQLDNISNNLANVSTNGYKESHAVFEDLIYQNLRQAGAASSDQTTLPTGLQVGLGTRAVATSRNFSQGNLQQTSNTLDLAIQGRGFFQVQLPDGTTGYTRDGSFQVSAQGQLVTNAGYTVQPGITIPHRGAERDDRQRRHGLGHPARPGDGTDDRPAADRQLHQPGRPRAQGRQPLWRNDGVGNADAGQRRHQRPGHAAAGLRRDLERQCGRRSSSR